VPPTSATFQTFISLFSIQAEAINWLDDSLTDCRQANQSEVNQSDDVTLRFGVPQGSVIGPKQFIKYVEDVDSQFEKHDLCHHLFADDIQGLASGPAIASSLADCFTDVNGWCGAKSLQLNAGKTWFDSFYVGVSTITDGRLQINGLKFQFNSIYVF